MELNIRAKLRLPRVFEMLLEAVNEMKMETEEHCRFYALIMTEFYSIIRELTNADHMKALLETKQA